MSWVAAAIGGGALLGAFSSRSAARTQANAANRATEAQLEMFRTTREDQRPWREAGQTSLADILRRFGLGEGGTGEGYFSHQFNRDDLNAGLAPNYEFMREQGQGAVSNMANAMGGLGGNSLTAISRWTQDYAQNAYQQAFQNYNSQRNDIFNRLASIAGLGQAAGSNATTGGSSYANGIGNSLMGAGNAMAAGAIGSANAINGGINSYLGYTALNRLLGGGGGGGAPVGGPS